MIEAPWWKYDLKPRNFTLQIDEGILKEHCRAPRMTPRWVFFVNGPLVSKPSFPTFLVKLLRWFPPNRSVYTPEIEHSPWKMMVGRWVSFWDCLFLGAMLNFWGVYSQMIGDLTPKKDETQNGFTVEEPRFTGYSVNQNGTSGQLKFWGTEDWILGRMGLFNLVSWFRIVCCAQSDPKFVPSMDLCPKWS